VTETSYQDGSAIGIGDLGVRMKLNAHQGDRLGLAFQGDVRLPTGSVDNLLGLGVVAVRGLGVASAEFGRFTPHVNVGYLFRAYADSLQNHSLVGAAGFDHMITDGVTLDVDVLAELELDGSTLRVPPPIDYTEPFTRSVPATTIPDTPDNRVDATFGFKWSVPCTNVWSNFCATGAERGVGATIITSAVVPLNNGGLRPGIIWSAGVQYKF
jgi:hypothetical protein